MKAHERDMISYRPEIDYDTKIRNFVESRIRPRQDIDTVQRDENTTGYNTEILKEFEEYNLNTVLDAYEQMLETERLMDEIIKMGIEHQKQTGTDTMPDAPSGTGDAPQYTGRPPTATPDQIDDPVNIGQTNPDGEDENARDAIVKPISPDLDDIAGTPIRNPVFAAEEVKKEIDNVKNIIQDVLEIDLDTDDLDDLRDRENKRIQEIRDIEKDDISYYTDYDFTEIEKEYIEKLIRERGTGIKSLDDYIDRLIKEHIERGSDRVDYARLRDDVKRSFALTSLASSINVSGSRIHGVSYKDMDDVMGGDTQGGLVYLVEEASLSDVKSMAELNYRRTLRDAKVIRDNMERHNDAEFREALYEHFAEVDKLKRKYTYKRKRDSITGEVASIPFSALNNSTKSMVDTTWDNVIVDMIGSSYTLTHQLRALQEVMDEQKELSLMYRFADLIDREFDFEHKDVEMQTFVSRHGVKSMR